MRHAQQTLVWALALLAIPILALAAVSRPQPYPGFWPSGQALRQSGFDYWRVWETRCAVRSTPTTAYTLLDRHAVLLMWINELRRQGYPVELTAPPNRLSKLAQLVKPSTVTEACQEVDSIYRGLEATGREKGAFAEPGSIAGKVIDDEGAPVAGADVTVYGSPLGGLTDASGAFRIANVPTTGPRYTLRAWKPGYLYGYAGGLGPTSVQPAEALILLEKKTPENTYRGGKLALKVCWLTEIKSTAGPAVPFETAVIDPKLYPKEVLPYLAPSSNIDAEEPTVIAQAQTILATVPEADRRRATVLARGVYNWMARNIEYDAIDRFPDDPTGGNWQLTFGAWGRSVEDWCYKPSQVLKYRRANVIEFERLAVSLLRVFDIPARTAIAGAYPVCQWWVQLATGNGYWANMQTFRGRLDFERTGNVREEFPSISDERIGFYSLDAVAPIHMTWDAARPCLWLEDFGRTARTRHNPSGLKAAQAWVEKFKETGRLPKGVADDAVPVKTMSNESYMVSTRGLVIDLATLGEQTTLTFRFPVFVENQYRATTDIAHWTNHPEWVKTVRREKKQDEETKQSVEWHVIDFDLTQKAAPAPEAAEAAPAG